MTKQIRCNHVEPGTGRCQMRAYSKEIRFCPAHNTAARRATARPWSSRGLANDLHALGAPLDSREAIGDAVEAVLRLELSAIISRKEALTRLRACEAAILALKQREAALADAGPAIDGE